MKKIFTIIGLLIIVTILMVGCSTEKPETNLIDESSQGEEAIGENEEAEEPVELEEPDELEEEEVASQSQGEVKSKVLRDIMSAERYTMKIKMYVGGEDTETTVTTVVADGNTASTTDFGGSIYRSIEIDDKFYTILDDSKMIIVSDRYEEDDDMDDPGTEIIYDDLVYVGKGKDTFLGNQRDYEEYKIELGKVRYFFDGNDLDGMELFIYAEELHDDEDIDEDMKDMSMILDIEYFKKEVDMSAFELPKDYQIVGGE